MLKISIAVILTHFLCDKCQKWWSVLNWKKEEITVCPHCGHAHYASDYRVDDRASK